MAIRVRQSSLSPARQETKRPTARFPQQRRAFHAVQIMEFIQAKQEQEDAKAALHGVASGQDDQFDEEEDEDEQPR